LIIDFTIYKEKALNDLTNDLTNDLKNDLKNDGVDKT